MDEKLNLVMTLKASIDRARYIIDNANLYCFLVTDCGWKPDYIWEILNSNVKNEIAERVINKWNQGYAGSNNVIVPVLYISFRYSHCCQCPKHSK